MEIAMPGDMPTPLLEEVYALSERENMPVIAQHYDTYEADYAKHYEASVI